MSSGKHLLTLDGTSGSVTVNKTLAAHISASNPQNSTSTGGVYAGGKVAGFVDTRGVTLSRVGAHGETFDGDGTVHGDTTYSYVEQDADNNSISRINWQVFHPSFSPGFSTKQGVDYGGYSVTVPDVSWTWDPWESDNTWDQGNWSMIVGTMVLDDYAYSKTPGDWRGQTDSPVTKVITYKATDNHDGAEADASYVLTLHDILEVKTDNQENVKRNPRKVGDRITKTSPGQICKITVITAVSYGVKLTWTDIFGEWAAVWLKLNLELNYTGTTSVGWTVDVTDLANNESTYPECVDLYTHHYGVEDQYDSGGYLGPVNYSLFVPMDPCFSFQVHFPYDKIVP